MKIVRFTCLLLAAVCVVQAKEKPNVLLIICDDLNDYV